MFYISLTYSRDTNGERCLHPRRTLEHVQPHTRANSRTRPGRRSVAFRAGNKTVINIIHSLTFFSMFYSVHTVYKIKKSHLSCKINKLDITVAAPGFWLGEPRTEFHTWIFLNSCTAMASPKFRFEEGEHPAKMYSSKSFDNFWKIYKKNVHKNLKNFPKFCKNKI